MLARCQEIALESHDPKKQVGCYIVRNNHTLVTGTNTLPNKCQLVPGRIQAPGKYMWMEHAERNAIYKAARAGISLEGATLMIDWWPCVECTRAIIQSGIIKIIAPEKPNFEHHRWGEHFKISFQMLDEVGITYEFINTD